MTFSNKTIPVLLVALGLAAGALADDASNTNQPATNQTAAISNTVGLTNFTMFTGSNAPDPAIYSMIGAASFAHGNFLRALAAYNRELQMDPGNAAAYVNRGNVYCVLGKYEEALADYHRCFQIDPTNYLGFQGLARVCVQQGKYTNAIRAYDQCLTLVPNDAVTLMARADVYEKLGNFALEARDYGDAIKAAPGDTDAYNNFAWFRATCPVLAARDGKEAVKLATTACELTGWKRWDYLDTLAAACAQAGDFKAAIDREKQAIATPNLDDADKQMVFQHMMVFESHQALRGPD